MKKFNEEMYKEIRKNGVFEDQYYKYIIIDKKLIYKGWKSSWLEGSKFEFYGVMDTNKKDIFTLDNTSEIQTSYIEQARQNVLSEILSQRDYYTQLQKNNFDEKIKNDDFKRSILYYFKDGYSSNSFNDLFVKGVTVEDFEKMQFQKLVNTCKTMNNEKFLEKYFSEDTETIINDFEECIKTNVDEWQFNYNWNNGTPENKKIDSSFNNDISLKLNKINLIVNEYKNIVNAPGEELQKAKKLYNICKKLKDEKNPKSCYIYLKQNDYKFKVIDFEYLLAIFERGEVKAMTYRLFTNNDRNKLEEYNETTKNLKREDDIFILDILKIEYNSKIYFEEV